MPEIEITPEQEERLRALQEDIARDVVGKYGHVRPCDAVEYLLDRYEDDEDADPAATPPADVDVDADGDADAETDGSPPSGDDSNGATAAVVSEGDDAADADGGDDAMLNEMMSLLDTHGDKWGESSGDERYAVDLPDGSTEHVRTKDDVKALLFEHYR